MSYQYSQRAYQPAIQIDLIFFNRSAGYALKMNGKDSNRVYHFPLEEGSPGTAFQAIILFISKGHRNIFAP